MKEPEMKIIGEVIADVIKRREDALDESREKVLALTETISSLCKRYNRISFFKGRQKGLPFEL